MRYVKQLDGIIKSNPIVIGTDSYYVKITLHNSKSNMQIIECGDEKLFVHKVLNSLTSAKKTAKAELIEMGATFSEEIRNRTLTKKNKNV